MINMLAKDLKIVDLLGSGSRESLKDSLRFAVNERYAFAIRQLAGFDKFFAIRRPERMTRRTTDRFVLVFDVEVDHIVDGMLERSRYEISRSRTIFVKPLDFDNLSPTFATKRSKVKPNVHRAPFKPGLRV